MFIPDIEILIKNLKKLGGRLCCYSHNGKLPKTCDCKYGASGVAEETGCPEIRAAIELIEEYEEMENDLIYLKAKIQTCKNGHKYLADSHEYPCPICQKQTLINNIRGLLKT